MPVQQISVVPVRETANNGKSTPSSKDKNEGRKAPGRPGSRSSSISKASNSATGLGAASRTSVTPSSQDICSSGQLTHLEEKASDLPKHSQHTHTAVTSISSTALGSSAQTQKKQVKRRHRRKRHSYTTADCVDSNSKQDQTDHSDRSHSSDRSERGEKRCRASRTRREAPPRVRVSAPQADTTSEDEGWREARSWGREKARRGRHRSGISRERNGGKGGEHQAETMELQSMGSDEGKENQAAPENGGSLKKRHSSRGSIKTEGCSSQKEGSQGRDKEGKKCGGYKSHSPGGSSSVAEEGEELTTKQYQEKGSGGGEMAVPTSQKQCSVNGGTVQPCSDDSEVEVCRICHCEGDEECPLITPCWCTGSLRFVHRACLNQWIKSSDTRCCELCRFNFIMETKLKPLCNWEELQMSRSERRKIFCSVLFHLISIICVLWSVYVLVKRTAEELRLGRNDEMWRISLAKYYTPDGVLEWPFWTKLIVVLIGFTGGVIFMYIQCKVYLQLWRRLKAFNRIITVQNCPEKGPSRSRVPPTTLTNGKHETVTVPITVAPAPDAQTDSDPAVEAAVAPAQHPV